MLSGGARTCALLGVGRLAPAARGGGLMLLRLALAELRHRPGRALFLLLGYALGVAVMVVLLAVGEAMLEQARDRRLVGGGDVVVVPAGISPEVLRAGGATSLFLGIDQARFIQRSVLESPRARSAFGVVAASPVLEGTLLEIATDTLLFRAVARGEIPSRARAAGAAPRLLAGRWRDSPADRRWAAPSPEQLYHEIDRFHLPIGAAAGDSTWAEWHYFNAVLGDGRWVYLTFLVGGEVGVPGRWGGRLLLTVREPDGSHRAFTRDFPCRVPACRDPLRNPQVTIDTTRADLVFAPDARVEQRGGVYHVRAAVGGQRIEMRFAPAPHRYFPPADLGGATLISGYVAPALYAEASGEACLPRCGTFSRVQGYHDHNWGVWRDVSWEWGAASDRTLSLLYGVVRGDQPDAADLPLFAYLVDERGARGVYRPRALRFTRTRPLRAAGQWLQVPQQMRFEDARRGLRVTIDVDALHVTDLRRARRRFFLQMRGTATVEETGHPAARLNGFFETYVDQGSGVGDRGSGEPQRQLQLDSQLTLPFP